MEIGTRTHHVTGNVIGSGTKSVTIVIKRMRRIA